MVVSLIIAVDRGGGVGRDWWWWCRKWWCLWPLVMMGRPDVVALNVILRGKSRGK